MDKMTEDAYAEYELNFKEVQKVYNNFLFKVDTQDRMPHQIEQTL